MSGTASTRSALKEGCWNGWENSASVLSYWDAPQSFFPAELICRPDLLQSAVFRRCKTKTQALLGRGPTGRTPHC